VGHRFAGKGGFEVVDGDGLDLVCHAVLRLKCDGEIIAITN
jgi:hypothetical protein